MQPRASSGPQCDLAPLCCSYTWAKIHGLGPESPRGPPSPSPFIGAARLGSTVPPPSPSPFSTTARVGSTVAGGPSPYAIAARLASSLPFNRYSSYSCGMYCMSLARRKSEQLDLVSSAKRHASLLRFSLVVEQLQKGRIMCCVSLTVESLQQGLPLQYVGLTCQVLVCACSACPQGYGQNAQRGSGMAVTRHRPWAPGHGSANPLLS